jgi:hypothetical protein
MKLTLVLTFYLLSDTYNVVICYTVLLSEPSAIIFECHVTHCDSVLSVMFVLGTVFGITVCSLQFWNNS